ncbi:hypothetical protein Tco_1399581 [Tanacetum coccineum]
MAEENIPAPEPTRRDEQILHCSEWLQIGKGNLLLDLQKLQKNPIFRISVDIRQNTNFVRAFTTSANVPSIYIQLFWNTLTHDAKTRVYSFQVDEHWLTLSADLLRKALDVTPADSAHPFESPPAGKTDTCEQSTSPVESNPIPGQLVFYGALKESKKMSKRQLGTGGSNEGTGNILEFPDRVLAGLDPEPMKEDQTGTDFRKLHVSLAGPNPEHMDDEFLATAYPKVHENLKLITESNGPSIIKSIQNQESEKSPKEIIRIKREQDEEKQDSTYSIRSTDKVNLEEFDLKRDDGSKALQLEINQGKSTKGEDTLQHNPSSGWQITDTRDADVDSSMHRSDPESEQSEQSSDNIPMHLDPEGERPATPEPEWTIPPNDFPEPENNWANTYATTYQVPTENKLQRKTYDIGSFIKWFCRRTGKKKLCKADLEGPAFNLVKAFHKNMNQEKLLWKPKLNPWSLFLSNKFLHLFLY